jgi:hypothetical protein
MSNKNILIHKYTHIGFDLMFGQTSEPTEVDPESAMGSLNEDAVPFQGMTSASVRKRTALGSSIYTYIRNMHNDGLRSFMSMFICIWVCMYM